MNEDGILSAFICVHPLTSAVQNLKSILLNFCLEQVIISRSARKYISMSLRAKRSEVKHKHFVQASPTQGLCRLHTLLHSSVYLHLST
jgi:hypothetical protein